MAVVDLTITETFQGPVDFDHDLLPTGSGVTGADYGPVANGIYGPLTNIPAGEVAANISSNTGHLDLYVHHDGIAEITDVKFSMAEYGAYSSYAYGGGGDATSDWTAIRDEGIASTFGVADKNNSNGTAGGLWFHMNRLDFADSANKFNPFTEGSRIRVVGRTVSGQDGLTTATGFTILKEAMARDVGAGTEGSPTAPADGTIGPSGNAILGESAHMLCRLYVRTAFNIRGGYFQWEYPFTYGFTA